MPKFRAKMGSRAAKNGTSEILTINSNSAESKTPLAVVSSKLNQFDKMNGNAFTIGGTLGDFQPFQNFWENAVSLCKIGQKTR